MAAPRWAPPLRLFLLPRSQAGDFVNVGAIDADVVQLAIRIVRQFLQHAPIHAAGAQESRKREHLHGGLLFIDRPPFSLPRAIEADWSAPSPRRTLGTMLHC